jgi:hypothetical protein
MLHWKLQMSLLKLTGPQARLTRLSESRTLSHYSAWFRTVTEQVALRSSTGGGVGGVHPAGEDPPLLLLPLTGTELLRPVSLQLRIPSSNLR